MYRGKLHVLRGCFVCLYMGAWSCLEDGRLSPTLFYSHSRQGHRLPIKYLQMKNVFIAFATIVALFSCSKHSTTTQPLVPAITGNGHIGFNDYSAGLDGGIIGLPDTISGKATGGLNITIFTPNTPTWSMTIYNLPTADTGTFPIFDAEDSAGVIGSADLYIGYTGYPYAEDTTKYSTSGTLTKTSATSFQFTCTMEGFGFPNPTTGFGSYIVNN
jgi:hypothetical protein